MDSEKCFFDTIIVKGKQKECHDIVPMIDILREGLLQNSPY